MPKLRRVFPLVMAGVLVVLATGCSRRLDPRLSEGYDLVVEGKVDEAIALANALLADDPGNAPARNLIGLALYKAGDTEGSVNQYRLALDIDSKYPEAHFNLGNSYQLLGQIEEAHESFRNAVRYEPKFVQAHYNLGIGYRAAGQLDQALEELLECVNYDPQFYFAYLAMGQLFYDSGEFESAVTNLSRALELAPTQKELRVMLGNALLQSGRPDASKQAEEAFSAAVSIDSMYVDAVYNLGVSLAAQGLREDASVHFRRVLELTKDNPDKAALAEHVERFLSEQEGDTDPAEAEETSG